MSALAEWLELGGKVTLRLADVSFFRIDGGSLVVHMRSGDRAVVAPGNGQSVYELEKCLAKAVGAA